MSKFTIYLYRTASGLEVVRNKLEAIARSERDAVAAIQTGLRMLGEHGADPTLNRFSRLR